MVLGRCVTTRAPRWRSAPALVWPPCCRPLRTAWCRRLRNQRRRDRTDLGTPTTSEVEPAPLTAVSSEFAVDGESGATVSVNPKANAATHVTHPLMVESGEFSRDDR